MILILIGAFAGGFANGLTGFGTAITTLPFWLVVVPPQVAGQLAALAAALLQIGTLPRIWPHIRARAVLPFIVPGLIGVPLGLMLAHALSPAAFRLTVGVLMVVNAAVLLFANGAWKLSRPKPLADGAIGFAGGVMGGLAGLSGVLPSLWASIRPYAKDEKRALFQSYNFTILIAVVALGGAVGTWSWELGHLILLSLPALILGNLLGQWVYARLSGIAFDRMLLAFILVAGLTLIVR
jgi:hypothetical protein